METRPEGVVRRGSAGRIARLAALFFAAIVAIDVVVLPSATSTATKPAAPPRVVAPAPPEWEQLEAAVAKLRAGFRGGLAVYIEDLQTGRVIAFNEHAPVPAASLIKLPLAVAVYEQQLAGRISPADTVTLKAANKAAGSGVLKRYRSGMQLSVRELVELMIQRSDNTATNILTDLLGLEEINGSCRRQGLEVTCMPRYIMDLEARDRKIENFTSAADMARTLKALYARRILDAPSCASLLDVLKGQKVRDRLPRYLPASVPIAHKTGLMNGLCHDVGIIYGESHDYVVAVLTTDFPSFGYAKTAIGRIGQMVWRYDRGEQLAVPKAPAVARAKQPVRAPAKTTKVASRKR